MEGSPLPKAFLEKLRRAQTGDQEARAALVEENLRLVWSVVGRFKARAELEDLFQVGCVGLLRAVDRFDPSFGVRFSTYAVPLIIGEIRRDLRSQGPLKVSRGIKERATRLARCREELTRSLGREPTMEEAAEAAEMTVDEAVEAMDAQAPIQSLDAGGPADPDWRPLQDRLVGTPPEEARWLQELDVRGGLLELDPLERAVLVYRFYHDLTQQETAQRLETNQVRVSRIERRALLKVKKYLDQGESSSG